MGSSMAGKVTDRGSNSCATACPGWVAVPYSGICESVESIMKEGRKKPGMNTMDTGDPHSDVNGP